MTIKFKTCPNCSNIVLPGNRFKKFCCSNCCKRYWDKTHPEYYKEYYRQNRKKILKYYKDREIKYKRLRHNYYKGKKEVRLTKRQKNIIMEL